MDGSPPLRDMQEVPIIGYLELSLAVLRLNSKWVAGIYFGARRQVADSRMACGGRLAANNQLAWNKQSRTKLSGMAAVDS